MPIPSAGEFTLPADTELPAARLAADGLALPTAPDVLAMLMAFNGATADRWRGNTEVTLLASAIRSTTTNSPDQTNYNARGVVLYVNVTAYTLGSLTPRIQLKDPVSGTYGDAWIADTAIGATGLYIYQVYPGVGGDVEGVMREFNSMVLPRTWRATIIHGTGDNITYSVAAAPVL